MTVHGKQTVTGLKTFEATVSVYGNIIMNVNKTVDGVDLSKLASEAVYKHLPQAISGDKTFTNISVANVTVSCLENCSLTSLLNKLSETTVKTNEASIITGLKTFTESVSVAGNITVNGFVNGVKIPDGLVVRNKTQRYSGKKIFINKVSVKGNTWIKGLVNGVNVTDMYRKALRLTGDQTVTGRKTFENELIFKRNLNLTGTINGINIPADLVKVKGNETITAHKIFKGSLKVAKLAVDNMEVEGLVDNVNVTELFDSIIKINGVRVIKGNVTFEDGFKVTGNMVTKRLLNGINLTDLDINAMKVTGDQVITGQKVCCYWCYWCYWCFWCFWCYCKK